MGEPAPLLPLSSLSEPWTAVKGSKKGKEKLKGKSESGNPSGQEWSRHFWLARGLSKFPDICGISPDSGLDHEWK